MEELNKKNAQKFKIGKKVTGYEVKQMMRCPETGIRKEKGEKVTALSSGDAEQVNKSNRRIKAYKAKYNEICDITGLSPETRRMSITATQKSIKYPLQNSGNGGIIKVDNLNSLADPMKEVTGSAEISHPDEIKTFRKEIEKYGASLVERDDESLAYSPGIKKGQPGTVYISKGASYSAWCHEMQHLRDDFADGWSGMRIIENVEKRYEREKRAYQVEIDMAKKANRPDIAARLTENLEKERKIIYGETS